MTIDIFAVPEPPKAGEGISKGNFIVERNGDIFRYAEPIAPLPTTQSKIKPPASGSAKSGSAMRPIMPALGKRANIPSPIPPDTKQSLPSPHPEVPAKPVVPPALRAGNPETLQQRIPRPKKPRYQLQVPMKEAFDRAHAEILGELNYVSHPEDKERYQEALDDLEKVFVSGSERLMTRFLEDHVGWKTFRNLVQSLKDEEPAMTSRSGIYGRANDEDIFRYADPVPVKPIPTAKPIVSPVEPVVAPKPAPRSAHEQVNDFLATNEPGQSHIQDDNIKAKISRTGGALWINDVEVPEDKRGQGHFKRFLNHVHSVNPHPKTFVGNVANQNLAEFLDKNGWIPAGDENNEDEEYLDSYWIPKKRPALTASGLAGTGKTMNEFSKDDADIFRYEEPKPLVTHSHVPKMTHIPSPSQASAELNPTGQSAPPKPPLRKMGVHPLPEKAADPWWHDTPHTNWLRHADEISRTPLQSSGGTRNVWKINLGGDAPGHDYGAIWKARDDDNTAIARPWTIPEGNPHGHEAAAWEMAHILGLGGMVPPTVSRANRNQVGSAQHFVPDQDKAIRSPFPFGKPGNAQLPLAAAFDALTMNTDRHMGNWLVDPTSGQLTLIDHGLLFPHTHKKPLVGNGEILDHAMNSGVPIPAETVEWVKEWPHLERSMKRNGLTDDQIALTQSRLFSLADAAAKGDSWRQWLKKSGIGSNYLLK